MTLTDRQRGGLKELMDIAFCRTTSSILELTGQKVLIDVTEMYIYAINKLIQNLENFIRDDVVTVHQIFTGRIAGDALLIFDYRGATALTGLLTDEKVDTIDVSAKEVLIEVGNILLNACLGTFGNILKVHITFSVPRLHLSQLNDILSALIIGNEELRYALLIVTAFKLKGREIRGYLVIVLGVGSLDKLLEAVEKLG